MNDYRLHSRSFAFNIRFAALLLLFVGLVVPFQGITSLVANGAWLALLARVALASANAVVSWWVWSAPKQVFATSAGLAIGSGRKRRLVAWSKLIEVRDRGGFVLRSPWHPRQWQIDLRGEPSFIFSGVKEAREVIWLYALKFVAQTE